ncbi:MAG: phage virion morphogenesis protein [Firmicutes bacterium]|nr:phage virion morphogenesis protein [Bacillota bacterium]
MAIKITGDWTGFERQLQKLVAFNFTGLHKEIGEAMVSSTQERFENGVGPDGKPWPPSRRAREGGGQTLVDTARLKNSITYRARPDQVAIGTNVIYAAVMQGKDDKPTTIRAKRKKYLKFKVGDRWLVKKSVKIPARPFIGVSEDDEQEIKEIIQERIEEALR